MTFETVIRSAWLREAVRSSPLGPFMDGFVDSVASVGYTAQSMYGLVLGATQLARHLTSIGLTDVTALRDQHVESFIATLPRYRCRQVYWMRQVTGTRAAHHMIEYLRRIGATEATRAQRNSLHGRSGAVIP